MATPQRALSVVIPALNESKAIQQVVASVPVQELARIGYATQIVVVDNGSTDGTGDLARQAGAEVVVEPNRGYGRAYKAGYRHARGEIIVSADADMTYPLETLPELVQMMDRDRLDFLTTNRFALMDRGAMPFRNKAGNALLTFLTTLLFGLRLKDSQSGMWLVRRSLLDRITLKSDGMPLSQELKIKACKLTRTWREAPIVYRQRVGEAKLRPWRDGLANLWHLFQSRWQT
ncbi:MAG: glycosyltransferase family 2 protein [Chloroflexi bacterium]|nr:glycosyltransferase family 2 protein [Chloroflexota bacterium]